MLNVDLLERAMAHIEADPGSHNPALWGVVCANGDILADFAGWLTMLHDPNQRPPRGFLDRDGHWRHDEHWIVNGVWMPAHAARVAGLSRGQRNVLFAGRWGVPALRAGVDALVRADGAVEAHELGRIMAAEQWRPGRAA